MGHYGQFELNSEDLLVVPLHKRMVTVAIVLVAVPEELEEHFDCPLRDRNDLVEAMHVAVRDHIPSLNDIQGLGLTSNRMDYISETSGIPSKFTLRLLLESTRNEYIA